MTIAFKQFIFGDALAWYKDVKPCGLRNAVKRATGTTCFVYQRGELVQTLNVRELFVWYMHHVKGFGRVDAWSDTHLALNVAHRLRAKQDQNNKLLQKIRALV